LYGSVVAKTNTSCLPPAKLGFAEYSLSASVSAEFWPNIQSNFGPTLVSVHKDVGVQTSGRTPGSFTIILNRLLNTWVELPLRKRLAVGP